MTYVLFPKVYLFPFAAQADPSQFIHIQKMTIVLLYFVAFYSIFDTMNIIFACALKGAGETRWVMITSGFLSWLTLIIPTYFSSVVYNWGLYVTWSFVTLYIMMLGIVFFLRFLGGKWESMRVIEEVPMVVTHYLSENQAG